MLLSTLIKTGILCLLPGLSITVSAADYVKWTTFKPKAVNLGGWLVQESTIDTSFWAQYSGGAPDEWGLCVNLGNQCGPVLTKRYASWITTADIDILAASGINTLRIPTTYSAWVKVPGSQLYSGNQVDFLKTIANYAISKYGMHIIVDIHSLPGGVNGMAFGEREGAFGWFNNVTALQYSYKAVDAAIAFIQNSGSPQSYTLEPLNEPVDNRNIMFFGTPLALSDNGAAWVVQYIKGVLQRVKAVNPNIPVAIQDGFKGEAYFAPQFDAASNLVFDIHNYYFAGRGANSDNVTSLICADARASPGDKKFPVFVGEWSIQTELNNRFANRKKNLQTGLCAFDKYTQGSAYWTAKFFGNATVDGEGTQADYWNYQTFIKLGYTQGVPKTCCT
ncbi:cellulase-like protein 2 [Elsinoe australis]|uniref:glucan 1,3-beta-glucosidase n=1 Tax=Elsinoe australis TaxID=40998 RepID=A0A4U7B9M3_9PEZI|nr:cellulase-like protein 2 [Elsinoe australis]